MKSAQELYETMLTIRILEDKLQELCNAGEAGDLHFNKGQEAIAVGVCDALAKTDHIVTHHRTIAHQIARGAALYPLVAELLGRKTGTNGGYAGEMHISDKSIRHAFSFQLVGTCIPVAAGLAWALKNHHKNGEVVAVFFGDAATSNGQFHEGLGQIAIQSLPVLLVCENNHLAGNIRPNFYTPKYTSISNRAGSYGIRSYRSDGNDVEGVRDITRQALDFIHTHELPVLIELDTTRLCWHKQGQRDARPAEEIEKEAQRDPLPKILARHENPADALGAKRRISAMIDDVIKRVLADGSPEMMR